MPDYLLEFQAHIDERRRPENFPHTLFIREYYQNVGSDEQLKEIYNKRFETFARNPGITVYFDDEIIDASRLRFDQRTYVPWHMITYFHGKATLVTPPPEQKNLADASLDPSDMLTERERKQLKQ